MVSGSDDALEGNGVPTGAIGYLPHARVCNALKHVSFLCFI